MEDFHKATNTKDGRRVYCKRCMKERNADGYSRHKSKRLASMKTWVQNNRTQVNAKNKRWRMAVKLEVLTHYSGGEPRCSCCGERDLRYLVMDHVHENGAAHRKAMGWHGSYRIYIWLKKSGFPDGFDVLCHNCNYAKTFCGGCDHKMTYGILSGPQIAKEVEAGTIQISPYDASRLNPASYDLLLGRHIAVYRSCVQAGSADDWDCDGMREDGTFGIPGERLRPRFAPGERIEPRAGKNCLDAAQENPVARYEMDDRGFVLLPGIAYLMHTEERIRTDRYVPIIDGKSSIGRLFCFVHVTAGYGDPGFDGQYTLEVAVLHPLVVYPGMRFCQMRFHTLVGEQLSYQDRGNYKGELAKGPIPSQSWKMFRGQV